MRRIICFRPERRSLSLIRVSALSRHLFDFQLVFSKLIEKRAEMLGEMISVKTNIRIFEVQFVADIV